MDKVLEIFREVNALMVLIDKAVMLYRAQNYYKGLLKTTEISKN